ncbi:diacylglycerol/lipid kinase family protein [Agrobacterium rubi]|uniref:Diacylglycerol kinase family lipid kinase n=2 Tax=Agrobacterium rubi TaxID=28099 RepID=A0AAE7UQ15_9HYPH|nr:diacylglycerol kinase family protein [Agrobacterium rubi]MBP1881379.1 diacylglycerol kinase family enzyme [Agrobacterium rubi]MCL6655020.1 diacylglycerol kinase [Agrobacterium rubi]NTE85855.1 diacylglycerol kinase family lipid kinase [Agrobacterium rubi]NTF01787.1 diacylglycerol kinase family lipid kinase [Agrobacterium rubi]NTF36030.1 diacylglycerol kinase family lipid kinase [Agrobacterium rubi]
MKLVAIFNRDGGTFKTTDMDAYCAHAQKVFSDAGHDIECRLVSGKDIVAEMERTADDKGLDGLIAGGGDGTISAAAGIAWKHGIALGVVPAGTMNLFARSLKLPLDIWQAVDTLAQGHVHNVDIASANGRPFVHQFSAGLHARMVRYRDKMEYASRLGKIRANIRAAIGVVLNPPKFDMEFTVDGVTQHRRACAISASNNEFGQSPLLVADDITQGKLGLYIAEALTPSGVTRLAIDIVRGKLKENAAVTAMAVTEAELHFPRRRHDVRCVMDGELLSMKKDVLLKIHAGELKVIVAKDFASV